jgi:hypothetical protein
MMFTGSVVNDIGLGLDIIGALLLWKFGLPETINREGRDYVWVSKPDETMIARARIYDRWGRAGLAALILGFFLQLVSNHL